ncbi:MAG: GNAT superfamily N-acetyltransferase, partial [Myxococcota bacterium]
MDHPDHRFDADYEEVLVLRNGTEAKLRLIRPEDKKLILDGLQSMSPESRYRRFFTQRDGLSESELVYLTELDHEMHFAIGAATTEADGSQVGLGVARFIRSAADPTLAEAAIAVVDSAHGQGLGRQLFVRLVDAAVERNVRTFRCEMLAKNDAMLKLLESLFGKLTIRPESGLVVVDC